jgi:uncharacterized membrane protein
MGRNFVVTETVTIRRAPEEVYAFTSDYHNDVLWRHGVVEMRVAPAGPLKVGSRTRERMSFFGRRLLTEAEVTEVVPNRKTAFRSLSGPISVSGYRLIEPDGFGTRLTFHLAGELDSIFSAFAPLIRPVFRRQVQRDLVRLRTYLERTASPAAPLTSRG